MFSIGCFFIGVAVGVLITLIICRPYLKIRNKYEKELKEA
jgi:hypothetical protein